MTHAWPGHCIHCYMSAGLGNPQHTWERFAKGLFLLWQISVFERGAWQVSKFKIISFIDIQYYVKPRKQLWFFMCREGILDVKWITWFHWYVGFQWSIHANFQHHTLSNIQWHKQLWSWPGNQLISLRDFSWSHIVRNRALAGRQYENKRNLCPVYYLN
jgi:hypothetical protein